MPSRQPLGIRIPLWALKISRVRVPVMNVTLVAFSGGTAVGALVMWFFGVQATLPTLTERGAAVPPDVVVSKPFADDYVATAGIMPLEQQGTTPRVFPPPNPPTATAPPSVSAPMIVMSAAMTVMSTPEGARVTVDGIGWGETPVTIRHLRPGPKVLRLTKEGYVSQRRIVSVPDDRRPSDVQVTLRARN